MKALPQPLYHYIVVRSDLPRGIQAAQVAHAAGESSPGGLPAGTFAVVLAVDSEDALMAVAFRLQQEKVPHVLVYEPDAPYNGELLSVGIVPGRREAIRKHLSSIPLLK